jgi:hypothetical protein
MSKRLVDISTPIYFKLLPCSLHWATASVNDSL